MGLFSRKTGAPTSNGRAGTPDWSKDPIVSQSRFALPAPPIFGLTQEMINEVGRGSLYVALQRMLIMMRSQTYQFASALPKHGGMANIEAIFDIISLRDDFDPEMLFDALTYFGPTGVATRNSLIEQVPAFLAALEEAAKGGYLQGD